MSDDAVTVDYSGTSDSDSDSESDKVPSRLPESQLERNREFVYTFWRLIPASESFMQVSDAHLQVRSGSGQVYYSAVRRLGP